MTITIGIDPHKGSHTAVAIDSNEHVLDEIRVRSCSTQTVRRREWAERFEERTWAVESAHDLGYLLAQQLVAAGENVIDVPPVRASRVRVSAFCNDTADTPRASTQPPAESAHAKSPLAVTTWFDNNVPPATLLGVNMLGYSKQLVEIDVVVMCDR